MTLTRIQRVNWKALAGQPLRKISDTYKNPHFWLISLITVLLIIVYLQWPWQEWKFSQGILKGFGWLSILFNFALFELQYHLVGSLFLVPIIYASIVYKFWGSLIVSSFAIAGMWPLLNVLWFNATSLLTNISLLLLPIVVVLVAKIEFELRRKDKQILIEHEKEQRIYLTKILETQERERQRLAEMLHDDTVQTLLAVASYAELIEADKTNGIEEIKKKANLIKAEIRGTVGDLRKIIVNLRPGILDTMGLVPAINWLIDRKRTEENISISLVIRGQQTNLNPSSEEIVFRIVQEALQNIIKHSKATEVVISLEFQDSFLKVTAQDNGTGFILPVRYSDLVTQGKLGIVGMHQRVRNIGGKFEIHSQPGGGALLEVEVPAKLS